ncbi:MAG TPA: hypothetical protein DD471_15965, partial [Planctomycetes bacterium]|nr:hypothetical protein [Planctomycetota bacterium]
GFKNPVATVLTKQLHRFSGVNTAPEICTEADSIIMTRLLSERLCCSCIGEASTFYGGKNWDFEPPLLTDIIESG